MALGRLVFVDFPDTEEISMLPAALGMAAFLIQLDVKAAVIAMSAIAAELGLSLSGYARVIDAYCLPLPAHCWPLAFLPSDMDGAERSLAAI